MRDEEENGEGDEGDFKDDDDIGKKLGCKILWDTPACQRQYDHSQDDEDYDNENNVST